MLSPELQIVGVSDAYLRATMTTREGILGKGLFEVFPDNPDTEGATGTRNLRASLGRVLSDRVPDAMAVQKYDIRRPESEGGEFEERFWSPLNSPVLGPDGKVRYIIHRVEDVTEFIRLKQRGAEHVRVAAELRTHAEQIEAEVFARAQQVQEANEKLRLANKALESARSRDEQLASIVEHSDDAIISEDSTGIIRTWNEGAERLFGFTAAEMVGQPLSVLAPPDRRMEWPEFLNRLRNGERVIRVETVRMAKDGRLLDVSLTLSPLKDSEGNFVGISKIARDMSARKRAEEAMREAMRSAEAANRAKSDFLAHMSHEIRTPLNGVIGMLELLQPTELTDVQRRYIGLARSSAELLTTVINDILDFSKIEAGKLEIASGEFNLLETVEDVVAMVAPKAVQKGLEVACRSGPGVPSRVIGDADRLRQVLINLVGNAIKFTERGAVVVEVTVESGPGIRFEVRDTGIGIAPDRMSKLFRAFSQADASTTRMYGGTGLGLVISKQLVGLMGGEIGVKSEPGLGSQFWFTLPLPPVAVPERVQRLDPRTLRILAVDDSPMQREVLQQQLSSWGLVAQTAESGEQGLSMLLRAAQQNEPFRVAIVDSDMPGMDGFEFVREVKSRKAIDQTVLMILLAVDSAIEPARLREMGIAGQMTKPVRQSQLFDTIMNALASAVLAAPGRPEPRRIEAAVPRTGHSGARVPVAEDNEINRIVVTETLTRLGYRCESVVDGKQAVDAAKRGQFDLLIMDCQMPVMDGFEAARAIRAFEAEQPDGPHILIIALTANALKGDRELCLAAGMDAYATKPINPAALAEAIDGLLSGRPALGRGEPIDVGALVEQCLSNVDLVSRLLKTFEEEAVRDFQEIKRGAEAGDAHRIGRAAHALTGAAGVMFARGVSGAAADIEALARLGNLSAVSSRIARLQDEITRCLEFMPHAKVRVEEEGLKGARR